MQRNSLNTHIQLNTKLPHRNSKLLLIRQWHAKAEINLLNSRNNSICNYIKRKLSSPTKLSYLINHDGNTITADAMIAQELNTYISLVYIFDDGFIPQFPQSAVASEMISIHFEYSRL